MGDLVLDILNKREVMRFLYLDAISKAPRRLRFYILGKLFDKHRYTALQLHELREEFKC